MTENASWLISCPISDGNFKERLKRATIEDIETALQNVIQPSKVKTLSARLKRLKKEAQNDR